MWMYIFCSTAFSATTTGNRSLSAPATTCVTPTDVWYVQCNTVTDALCVVCWEPNITKRTKMLPRSASAERINRRNPWIRVSFVNSYCHFLFNLLNYIVPLSVSTSCFKNTLCFHKFDWFNEFKSVCIKLEPTCGKINLPTLSNEARYCMSLIVHRSITSHFCNSKMPNRTYWRR